MPSRFLQDSCHARFHRGDRVVSGLADSDPPQTRTTNHCQCLAVINWNPNKVCHHRPHLDLAPPLIAMTTLSCSQLSEFFFASELQAHFLCEDLRRCHVHGCLQSAPLDTVSRSRCGPHVLPTTSQTTEPLTGTTSLSSQGLRWRPSATFTGFNDVKKRFSQLLNKVIESYTMTNIFNNGHDYIFYLNIYLHVGSNWITTHKPDLTSWSMKLRHWLLIPNGSVLLL